MHISVINVSLIPVKQYITQKNWILNYISLYLLIFYIQQIMVNLEFIETNFDLLLNKIEINNYFSTMALLLFEESWLL